MGERYTVASRRLPLLVGFHGSVEKRVTYLSISNYSQVQQKVGTLEIPLDTFNKFNLLKKGGDLEELLDLENVSMFSIDISRN